MSRHYDIIHPSTNARVGFLALTPHGWYFVSQVSNHKGSRVPRDSAAEAMPSWAKRMECDMVPADPKGHRSAGAGLNPQQLPR